MAEIINLNRLRKQKARETGKAVARHNRILHGRTKSEREAAEKNLKIMDRALDGARLEDD